MYDAFSTDYDRFVNWNARLAAELPFIEGQLQAASHSSGQAQRVLDAACGSGVHAIALAQRGYQAAGTDLSPRMIDRARANAAEAGVEVQFETAGFGEMVKTFGGQSFDALLCMGNSLPHLLNRPALDEALLDFAGCLRRGGSLIIQNRNFDAVQARRDRWMEPQTHRQGDREWLFLRFYDFDSDGLITFNILTLTRSGTQPWSQQVNATRLCPLSHAELTAALSSAGFRTIKAYGDMAGAPFATETSGNLVIAAML
jgi:SAM-dependent methyltransferase